MGGVIAMTHVVHGQFGARIGVGHRGLQAFAHGQRAAGVAAAVHGLGEEGVGVLAAVRLDDHVIGFRHRQANLVDRYRLDVLPVRGDHGELEAGDTEVEVAHRRAVDQAQADALAGPEQAGPVGIRGLAVEQVGVGRAADVGEIGGRHVHLRPGPAVAEGLAPALVGDIVDEIADGATALVVVVGLLLQLGQHARRALVGPVGEKHHIVSLVGERLRLLGIDDQRAVDAELLLEARVAVIPVGPALLDLEAVLVHAVRRDAGEAEAGHAVHVGRQQDAVPVVEVSCGRRLRTRRVTVSPSRQRSSGPGMLPLMAMAVRRRPVKSTLMESMVRSNWLPLSTVGWPGLVSAQTGWRHSPSPAKAPPAARLLTKVRRELVECMLVLFMCDVAALDKQSQQSCRSP